MKKITAILLILALCFSLTANTASAAVKISKTKATMEIDSTLNLKITGTKSTAKWSTTKKSIATVKDGSVTAIAEGQTTISATVNKKQYSCIITVVDSSRKEITAEKGTITELTTGLYIIGEDFPAGKYNVKTLSGSGNFFVNSSDFHVSEIMAEEGDETFDTHVYNNLRLLYGDEMEITNGVVLEFEKLD